MSEVDMLRQLWEKQEELNLKIGVDTSSLNEEQQTEWLLKYSRAMSQEIAELIDSVPWKWWAKYQEFDLQNARVEVVDLFHFIISLGQVLGMDAADIHNLYMQKNRVNFERQDSGYSEKDEGDNQDLEI